nr:histidine kinase [uncultured Caproiciproducens sp.]
MDTALANGDFAAGSNGRPKQISGAQELFQRAAVRLNIPLGCFVYDASLGSRLYELKAGDGGINEKALTMAQEALRLLPQVTVESAKCSGEPLAAVFRLSYGEENVEIEVKI